MLDPEPHDLPCPQSAAITETEQNARLEARGHRQQSLDLICAHHQRKLLRLTNVIDLFGQIQSPQCNPEQPMRAHAPWRGATYRRSNPAANKADRRSADCHLDWRSTASLQPGNWLACRAGRNTDGAPRPNAGLSWETRCRR